MKQREMESTAESLPLVLTVPETAKKLRVGIGRCYELARCGRLRWKHPRLRGEDASASVRAKKGTETPPLARGRRNAGGH